VNRRRSMQVAIRPAVVAVALCLVPALLAAPPKALHPPKSSRIVEGVSAGGVSIGDSYKDMIARWGKAEHCDLGNGNAMQCEWFAPHQGLVRTGVGALSVDLASPSNDGKVVGFHLWDEKANPVYKWIPVLTGWKTSSGIGLRSTPAAVRKAYGSRLREAPHPEPLPAGYSVSEYLVTKRNGQRWVTSFNFDQTVTPGRAPSGPERVHDVWIVNYKVFAAFYSRSGLPLK
jgi:hypothetical protein